MAVEAGAAPKTLPPRVYYWNDWTPDRQRAFVQYVSPRVRKAGVDTDSTAFGLLSDQQAPTKGSLENYLRHRNREPGVTDLTPPEYKEALEELFGRPWRARNKEGAEFTEFLKPGHKPETKPAPERAPLGIPFLSSRGSENPASAGVSGVGWEERELPKVSVHPSVPEAAPVTPPADLPPWSEEHRETGEALEDLIGQYERMSAYVPPEEKSNGHSHRFDMLIEMLEAAKQARNAGLTQVEIFARLYEDFHLERDQMKGLARLVTRVAG